jgi:hypothetical protein
MSTAIVIALGLVVVLGIVWLTASLILAKLAPLNGSP